MARKKWKSGWRKVPGKITNRIEEIQENGLIVACTLKITATEAATGKFAHVGIDYRGGDFNIPQSVIPPEENGRASKVNLHGKEIIRKDLPKELKEFGFYAPSWGDWSKGSHWVGQTREVYQRDQIAPKEAEISFEILRNGTDTEPFVVVKCVVEFLLLKNSPIFKRDLLFCLNLLQENVGHADLWASTTSNEEFANTLYVDWEILPPGNKEEVLQKLMSGARSKHPDLLQKKIADRYETLSKLQPTAYLRGRNGFRHYFGAKFSDDVVVFENLDYGNAAYVMGESWETLSKMSRIDLMKSATEDFERIVHKEGWKDSLREVVRKKLKK